MVARYFARDPSAFVSDAIREGSWVRAVKIAALNWTTNNIGDDIQTVAVMRYLPAVDLFLDRDHLRSYSGPKCLLVMNGWFLEETQNWPPSDSIKPVFFGFHVQEGAKATIAAHADYLRRHEPIGCRDRGTLEFIQSLGVDAYLSLCATLTFEPSTCASPDSLYLVEASLTDIHPSIRNTHGLKVKRVTHRFVDVSTETRLIYAKEIVATYRQKAAMVITSRIHCAMPCVAMGIPVLYIGNKNYRTEALEEVGLKRYSFKEKGFIGRFRPSPIRGWPKPLDIQDIQEKIRRDLISRIETALRS